jgi:CBS domain-containing protein
MHVEQIMSPTVRSCSEHDALDVAARLMWDYDVGSVPVLDAAGELVGIITDRDICIAAYTRGRPIGHIPVRDAMSRTVIVCRPEEPIEAVERRMCIHQIRRMPVVGAYGQVVGMLSLADIVRTAQRGHGSAPSPFESIEPTLAAICRPRS